MSNTEIVKQSLKKRYAAEKRFQLYGRCDVFVGFIFLALLLVDIVIKAMPAFSVTEIKLEVPVDRESLELPAEGRIDSSMISAVDFGGVIKRSLRQAFPEVKKRKDKKRLYKLVSSGAEFKLRQTILDNPDLIGSKPLSIWVKADDDVDTYFKLATRTSRIDDKQAQYIETMRENDAIRTSFNTTLFTASDSREPEQAGIRGALLGSFWTLLVTLLVSLPVGIAAAIYLEEFAPQNKITDFIAARLEMMIVGNVINESTRPPTSGAERGMPKKLINTARPSKPNTIDGTAARLLILISIKSVILFCGANSSR